MMLIAASLIVAFALRFGMTVPVEPLQTNWALLPALLAIGALLITMMRLNQIKVHAVENNMVLRLAVFAAVLSISAMAVSYLFTLPAPRSVPLIFGAVFFMSSVLVHFIARFVLELVRERTQIRLPVAIYGAGATGEQLAAALRQSSEFKPVCFLDDNRQLHGIMVSGLKVHPAQTLRRLIKKHGLKRILLAMPTASSYRRREILEALSSLQVDVIELPNMADEVGHRALHNGLQAKRFKDVASKSHINARNPETLAACKGKTILIAGAGGMMGAEISQQIIRFEPAKLVLFERNETALLDVTRQVKALVRRAGASIQIEARTGSIAVPGRMTHLLRQEAVQIIINAAHYGDPQLAEANLFDLLATNVVGPLTLAEVAISENIEQLILLSSERVAKPRHLVDHTQQLAETLVMGLAHSAANTQINVLRFGQTSGPVGDIVPLLEAQVRNGNSITLPHPEMTRLFLSTAKASDMILSALPHGAALHAQPAHMCKGTPRKVMDFVHKVVDLSGKGLRSDANPFGVDVKFCGLRPGEALHETCDAEKFCTPLAANPDLLLAPKPDISILDHNLALKAFREAIANFDEDALRAMLNPGVSARKEPLLQSA
ncbi:polysaccharide biosynthesis protein [Cognatishimia sp. SS12]|nr:polysaccharide biosynthesis protein [Cognatishimia sp. SS12]